MNNKLFIDVKTTGTDVGKNGIYQIDYMIAVDDQPVSQGQFRMNTFEYRTQINQKALVYNRVTNDEILGYASPLTAVEALFQEFNKYSKLTVVSYGYDIDKPFLEDLFNHYMPDYLYKVLEYDIIDTRGLVTLLRLHISKYEGFKSSKLIDVCEFLGLPYREDRLNHINYQIYTMLSNELR